MRLRPPAAPLLAFVLLGSTSACQKPAARVRADGSSTVFPITVAVAEEFGRSQPSFSVTVGISGTAGGLRKLCRREVDVAGASRPITHTEVEVCAVSGVEYVELPIAYDGIAVVAHPRNTWASDVTVQELKAMWEPAAERSITKWSQVRPSWPDRELRLFGPDLDSGTYDYFTQAIVGREHASRRDYTASASDEALVQGVANDEHALGFFGLAYHTANARRLKLVAVDDGRSENGAGPTLPSPETVRDGTYQPLSRPLLLYVAKTALDRPEVAAFVRFYLENGARLAQQAGSVPLPARAYVLGQRRAEARRTGTIFGGRGSQVGVSIEALLAAEER